jgi:very-short-patch-repair endonuclease
MSKRKLDTDTALWHKLKLAAREMRHKPTPAEKALWQRLRNRQIANARFRRQHNIDRFIADFYCAEAGLAIELDGPIHQYSEEADQIRQEILESLGFRVLRFTNEQVLTALPEVIDAICAALNPPDRPSP